MVEPANRRLITEARLLDGSGKVKTTLLPSELGLSYEEVADILADTAFDEDGVSVTLNAEGDAVIVNTVGLAGDEPGIVPDPTDPGFFIWSGDVASVVPDPLDPGFFLSLSDENGTFVEDPYDPGYFLPGAGTTGGGGGGAVEDPADPGYFIADSDASGVGPFMEDAADPGFYIPVTEGYLADINVKVYGALGDGTTNDTVAVQAAITAATAGSTVFFPKGTYMLDTLTINSKSNLTFSAPSATLKRIASPTNHMIRIGEGGACTNLRFDIAEIDGNSFAGNASTGTAFHVRNTTGFIFNGYIHHTWNHGFHFGTTASSKVRIDARLEFIGKGFTADATFSASAPNGCGVYFATAAPVTDGVVTVTGTDVKGFAMVYVAGCTRLVVHMRDVRRMGYRGLFCAGTGTVVGLTILNPTIEDCGVVYESSSTPGASLYGQGTNAIYVGLAPVTAQDAVVTGGKIKRTGENFVEGKCIVTGLVGEEGGFAYTSFGSGLAKEGIFLQNGGKISGSKLINPGVYGVHCFDSTATGIQDIDISSVEVIGATSKGLYLQQSTTGTANDIVIRDVTVRKGTVSPTHGIHLAATGGGSVGARCLIKDAVTVNTFSTSAVLSDATGGGTNTATVTGTTSV